MKKQITLRLDEGIVDWFRGRYPRGYQTEMNRVLRNYISLNPTERVDIPIEQKQKTETKIGDPYFRPMPKGKK